MAESSKAVFLSYASQDADAVKRICDTLRATGIEVWFDQSELVGGDAWDAKIRKQIKECALFLPVISANTNARLEGYFRREWRLAVERMHDMDDDVAFLLPVVIDDTSDAAARVPERFRERQWTRLKGGETPVAFGERVKKLLSGDDGGRGFLTPPMRTKAASGHPALHRKNVRWWWWVAPMFGVMMALLLLLREKHAAEPVPAPMPAPAVLAPADVALPASKARELIKRARAMTIEKYDSTADDFAAADALTKQALEVDPNDGEVWAFSSILNKAFVTRGFDRTPARQSAAREQAARALKLAPDSIEAQYAVAYSEREIDPAGAEKIFRQILARQPDHPGSLFGVSNLLFRSGHVPESQEYLKRVATNPTYAPLAGYLLYLGYFNDAEFKEAEKAVRDSIALKPSANSVAALAMVLLTAKGDAGGAAEALASASASRNEARTVWMTAQVELCRRRPEEALNALDRLTDDFIRDSWYAGPKAYWVGRAQALAGRPEAARIAWQAALTIVDAHLEKASESGDLHLIRGELLALLGRSDEALHEARVVTELNRGRKQPWFVSPARIYAALGKADEALPLLQELCPPKVGENMGWPLTPALLRLDPLWDKIRDDPRIRALAVDASPPAGSAPAVAIDDKSVAVLAFSNLSGDKDNEYFSDGISEEVLNVLAKVPGLKVTARTSAFYFKGRSEPIAEIARQLGVAYIVEGSVRRAGDHVRISAELIKAADGFQVWSDTFNRELKDVFAVQDEIAALVARNLRLKLGEKSRPAMAVDPEAYQAYLQGRQALIPRTMAGFDEAEKFFLQARAIAPNWAPVYAGLADVWRLRGFSGDQIRPITDRSWTPELTKAKDYAGQSLKLDPELPAAYTALGGTVMLHWDLTEAERLLRHALDLNPNEADADLALGRVLAALGQMDEAIEAFQRGAELNPLAPRILDNLAAELNFAGRYDEGWKVIERAAALQPDSSQIQCYQVRLLTSLERKEEALRAVEKLLRHPDPSELSMRRIEAAKALAHFGRQAEAEALVAQVDLKNPEHAIGLAYIGRGQEALSLLPGIEFGWLEDILWGSSFDSIRDDPRFVAFLRNTGLEEAQARATAWRIAHGVGPKVKP